MTIHLDEGEVELLISYLNNVDEALDHIRSLLADTSGQMSPDLLNVDGIEWLVKGGKPAPPDAGFSYAFAYTMEGELKDDTLALVQTIQRDGEVKAGDFVYRLGGRDKKLLNRVKVR